MNKTQASDLTARFRAASAQSGSVKELLGDAARDFVWVRERPIVMGTFMISVPELPTFFACVLSAPKDPENNYSLWIIKKPKTSLLMSTEAHEGAHLRWTYQPTKQDGQNVQRRAHFESLAGADYLLWPLPDGDIRPFAQAIVKALQVRSEADAVEGEQPTDGPHSTVSYWKISPGEGGAEWPRCCEEQVILLGWKDLGDLTHVDEMEFERRSEAIGRVDRSKQAWKFRNIQVGDRIIANNGTREVLGVGTVTGAYRYVAGADLPHQLPVKWEDTRRRKVEMPGWRRTIVRLTEATFLNLAKALPADAAPGTPSIAMASPAAGPSGGIDFDGLVAHLENHFLVFSDETLATYLLALQARRFVLLTGISGTGKTRLATEVAKLFASRQGSVDSCYKVIAVRPDWTDARALLGFYNPLTRAYVSAPCLELLLAAERDMREAAVENRTPRPHFLIFDEMNLARVEQFFSDFLSVMESGEHLDLHDDAQVDIPRRLSVARNVFVVGTVNVDETTYMFSPKVLDRAFVLEFNEVELSALHDDHLAATPLALSRLSEGLKLMKKPSKAEWERFITLSGGDLFRILQRVHKSLSLHNRHFGYRVARQVACFVVLAESQTDGSAEALLAAFDIALLTKVLPKLNGTQGELDDCLNSLLMETTALPRCSVKLAAMQKRLRMQGFVSFIA